MKALTVKQPWASLIVNGVKEYEFRSWQTKYRGKILIHAGMSTDEKYIERLHDYNLEYINGAIIGEAEIVDCILIDEDFNNNLIKENPLIYKAHLIGSYAWKLANVKKYDKSIYCKGKLSLWNYDL